MPNNETDPVTGAVNDPDFWTKVSPEDRRIVLSTLDPDFKGMEAGEQDKVLGYYKSQYDSRVPRSGYGPNFVPPPGSTPPVVPGLTGPDAPSIWSGVQKAAADSDTSRRATADRGAAFVKDFVQRNFTNQTAPSFDDPIADFTKLVPDQKPGEAPITSFGRAVAEGASSLTSRNSLLVAAGTLGVGDVPVIGKSIQSGLTAYFAAKQTIGASESTTAAYKAFQAGDYNEMARHFGYASVNALLAAMGARATQLGARDVAAQIDETISAHNERAASLVEEDRANGVTEVIPKSRRLAAPAPTAGTGTPDAGAAPPSTPTQSNEGPGPDQAPDNAGATDTKLDPIIRAIDNVQPDASETAPTPIEPPDGVALHPEERQLRELLDKSKLPEDQKQAYREELIRQFYGEKALAKAKGEAGDAGASGPPEAGAAPPVEAPPAAAPPAEAPVAEAPPVAEEPGTEIEKRKPIEIKVQDENGTVSTTPVEADVMGDLAVHDRVDGYGYSVTHVPSGLSINVGTHAQATEIARRITDSGIDLSTEHISDEDGAKIKDIIDSVLPSNGGGPADDTLHVESEPEHGAAPEIVKGSPYDSDGNTSVEQRQTIWDTVADSQAQTLDWIRKTEQILETADNSKSSAGFEKMRGEVATTRQTYEDGWTEMATAFGHEAAGKLREEIEGGKPLAPVVAAAEKKERKPGKIERGTKLSDPDEQGTRERLISQLEADPEHYLAEYGKRFGNVLNADDAATLFDEYNRDPAKNRVAVHPAAQWIRDELFRRAIEVPAAQGKNRVMFTAGGNASGKSSVVAGTGAEAQIVLDSTFSNPVHAERLVKDALEAGKTVTILYVNRPLDEALKGMIERAGTEGRVVSIDQLINSQRGAAQTVQGLREQYKNDPRVTFRFLNNAGSETAEAGIEIATPQDYTENKRRLNDLLDREYEGSRISETIYRRIRGSGRERSKPPGSGHRDSPGHRESEPASAAKTPAKDKRGVKRGTHTVQSPSLPDWIIQDGDGYITTPFAKKSLLVKAVKPYQYLGNWQIDPKSGPFSPSKGYIARVVATAAEPQPAPVKSKGDVTPAADPVRTEHPGVLGEESPADGERPAEVGAAPDSNSRDGGTGGRGGRPDAEAEPAPLVGPEAGDPAADVAEPGRRSGRRRTPATTRPALSGYRITPADRLGEGSPTDKAVANIEAIRLMKRIDAEARPATLAEQQKLVRYTGWGALSEVFEPYQKSPAMVAARKELQELVTNAEWKSMAATTPNAHYTSDTAIRGIWQAAERLGIKAGATILEPSMGAGHFFGLMPDGLLPNAKLAGVEIDPITARIASLLYPNAGTYPVGFENTRFPNNWFDLAIGNVPFGNYGVHDPAFKGARRGLTTPIHTYFFAKTLDKVRPGGLIAYITSRYTMDTKDSAAREYIAKEAKLLGAIRLPQTAFEKNAGTTVITDILFLQKRLPGDASPGEKWLTSAETTLYPGDRDNPQINEYYVKHPDMVLGPITGGRGRFGPEMRILGEVTPEKLSAAIARLPENVITEYKPSEAADPEKLAIAEYPEASTIKDGGFGLHDGMVVFRKGDFIAPAGLPKEAAARVKGMIGVRDAVRDVFRTQLADAPDADIDNARKRLGTVYDKFVKANGTLHEKTNRSAFRDDPDAPLLLALEKTDPETGAVSKSDIFSKRTVQSYKPVASAETAKEAMAISLNEYGRINWIRMAQLTGRDTEDLEDELGDLIYRDPETKQFQPADEYLSGDVRQKLAQAKDLARTDPAYERNVTALEAAKPPDLKAGQIVARLGAPWIPPPVIRLFVADLLAMSADNVSVAYSAPIATWRLVLLAGKATAKNTSEWAGGDVPADELIEQALNMKVPKVYKRIDEKTVVLDQKKTAAAQDMQQKLKDRFKKWVWEEPRRTEILEKLYNDTYNGVRLREYDGSHLTLSGANPAITLRAHQKNAVWRILSSGRNTLLAHVVGAGKTFEMIGAAMEMRRIGLARKPMITVPANIVGQFGKDFRLLYPAANIFVADETTFAAKNRQQAMAKVATGNWDAVIISHDAFQLLPVHDDTFNAFLQKELDTLEDAIREAKAGKADKKIQKELEKSKKRLEAKLRDKADREGKDNVLTFEELGVDALFVDEADLFKNLYFVTRATRIAGIPNSESNRAFDMLIKSRHVTDKAGGRLIFATGTPIANTIAEMYTMLRYLSHKELDSRSIGQFDAWAQLFGESVTGLETSPDGAGFRVNTRFAKFSNLPELQSLFRQVADVQTADMLKLPVPELFNGKRETISVPASTELLAYIMAKDERGNFLPESLMGRIAAIKGGRVDPRKDNMLKVTSDGRKAALDLRLIGLNVDPPESKVNTAVRRIFEIWEQSKEARAAQMVFSDLSTPNAETWNVYDEIRRKLTLKGVPAAEIAYAHDADTADKKSKLFAAVNAGKVRILIGSTGKMGAGTNAQKRLIALHHLDVPWRPRDVEQREGRILRQGNTNPEVHIVRYVTAPSFDAYMWGLVTRKAKFINQVMTGETGVREAEDVGGDSLGAAEAEAAATGNPLIKEKADVDNQVMRLSSLQSEHARKQISANIERDRATHTIAREEAWGERLAQDIATRDAHSPKDFSMVVGKKTYAERKDAGEALIKFAIANRFDEAIQPAGTYRGFELRVQGTGAERLVGDDQAGYSDTNPPKLSFANAGSHYANLNAASGTGTISSIDAQMKHLDTQLAAGKLHIEELRRNQKQYNITAETPFADEALLDRLVKRQQELIKLLDLGSQAPPADDDEEEASSLMDDGEHDHPADEPRLRRDAGSLRGAALKPVGKLVATVVKPLAEFREDIRLLFFPQALDRSAEFAGLALREQAARIAQTQLQVQTATEKIRAYFAQQPQHVILDFIARMEHGKPQADPYLDTVARVFREWLDKYRDDVQALGAGKLTSFYEHYFPHIWKNPKKAEVTIASLLGRRPIEGKKAFLKKRKHVYFSDAMAAGLVPIASNPVDLVLLKLREMGRYLLAHRWLNEMKASGTAKYIGERQRNRVPAGWTEIPDPIGTVYGSPTIPMIEGLDREMWNGLLRIAEDLDLDHQRVEGLRRQWGAATSNGKIRTRRGGPESVLIHEIGHQLDWKYGIADQLIGTLHNPSPYDEELRKLADLRLSGKESKYFGAYVRKGSEKIANMIAAYVHARALFEETAPKTFAWWEDFILAHPELKPIQDVRYGMQVETLHYELDHGGTLIRGRYYMPKAATSIIKNYLSPGLAYKGYYQIFRQASNLMLQFSLGFSGFHAGFVTFESMTSKLALAIKYAAAGRPLKAIRLAITVPLAPIENVVLGRKVLREMVLPGFSDPEIVQYAEHLVMAGGRAGQDDVYRTKFRQQVGDAIRGAFAEAKITDKIGALGRAAVFTAPAIAELAAWPVLEWLVPRIKVGAFAQMAKFEVERLGPDAERDQIRKALARAWDSVDNRFGQLVYDNLFWNKIAKDIAMVSVQSVGWNVGTFREILGGVLDTGRFGRDGLVKLLDSAGGGRVPPGGIPPAGPGSAVPNPEFTHRMAYGLAMPALTAIIGGILLYAWTHDDKKTHGHPRDWRDLFFPRNGQFAENGAPERYSIPSYMQSVVEFFVKPKSFFLNKLSPIVRFTIEELQNKDWQNRQVADPNDPTLIRWKERGLHAAGFFRPIVVDSIAKAHKDGDSPLMQAAPMFGLRKAPAYIDQSPAQLMMMEKFAAADKRQATPEATYDRSHARREIAHLLRGGKLVEARALAKADVQAGTITKGDVGKAAVSASKDPFTAQYQALPLEAELDVWRVSSPEEKAKEIKPILLKILNVRDRSPEEMRAIRQHYSDVFAELRLKMKRPA